MASEIIVQNLKGPASGSNANKIIVPSGHTLDASEGFTPPAGYVVRMGTQKHSTYHATSSVNTWVQAYTFNITGITAGNTIYMSYSNNDLMEHANTSYFRILRNDDTNLVQWARNTNGNGGWRGIRADAAFEDDDTSGGTRTYKFQHYNTSSGTIYVNYPSNNNDAASFLTWWEIAQ